jgi:hypothetical protein
MINDRLDGDLIGATTLSFFVPFLRLLGKISHRMGLRLDCSLFFFSYAAVFFGLLCVGCEIRGLYCMGKE